ncbi:sterile alpha motif domain-containing protein 11-like, partial [Sphaerodactylus townsendi]|uniref:sterile alpha motif domain-containing protein 11-like n=1 Tax=Sphaerodactylus townsendi TaxID=933632 RepID=UPI00202664A2
NSHTPLLEGAVTQMTPEEHYRRMMSALNEHGAFEEQQQQQQRLYQLANSMAVPSHSDLLRARQEVAAAAARNPSSMEAHLPSASNSSSQRRKQGLPQHRDSHFSERYLPGNLCGVRKKSVSVCECVMPLCGSVVFPSTLMSLEEGGIWLL